MHIAQIIGFVTHQLNCILFISPREEAEALAKKLRMRFYRTSVKDNLNVDEGEQISIL